MNFTSSMAEGDRLLEAPHVSNNEMISFRKSVDQRPNRSILSSPNPHTSHAQTPQPSLSSPPLESSTKSHGFSAVDKYTPITAVESTPNNTGGIFDDSGNSWETYPNSVYETIMNTQNRDWFQRPATYEVPQVKLIHGENMDFMKTDAWRTELKGYLSAVTPLFEQYEELNAAEEDYINNIDEEIPFIFEDANFNLEDRYYMDQVTSLAAAEKGNAALIRRMKQYLKKVDGSLKDYILDNKEKFESIGTEIHDIEHSLKRFQDLVKSKIDSNKNVLETVVVKDEALLNMELRLKNVCKLEKSLLEIDYLIKATSHLCDDYISKSENTSEPIPFSTLKDFMIKTTELEKELNGNALFENIAFLSQKKDVLLNLKLEIGGKILLQFVRILEDDLEDYMSSGFTDNETILLIMDAETNWPPLKFDDKFKLLLKDYIENLSSSDSLINAYQMYCDKIINKCRDLVKQNLPKPNEKETVLLKMSQLIRNMTSRDFNTLVQFVFSKSLIYFKRLYEQQKLLLDLGINALDSSKLDANMFLKLDIRSGINESIRIVQLRMSKIINCRSDMHAKLDFESFLKVRLNMCNFSRQCEQLTGEILTLNLNDVIVVHTEEYQKLLGERLNSKMKSFIQQKEDWLPFVVEDRIQIYVNDIFLSSEIIPNDWLVTMVDRNEPDIKSPGISSSKKSIIVNEKTFVASKTLIEVIQIIREIMIVTYNLPVKYCQNLENGLLRILGEFDKFALLNLISNPSILNTHLASNNSIVPLNNNNNINVNSIIFKNKEKNYTILAETVECIRELLPQIQQFFNNRDKQNQKIVKTATTISHKTSRGSISKLYSNLLINYQNSASLIYKCNIPPPSESADNAVLTARRSLDRQEIKEDKETQKEEKSTMKEDATPTETLKGVVEPAKDNAEELDSASAHVKQEQTTLKAVAFNTSETDEKQDQAAAKTDEANTLIPDQKQESLTQNLDNDAIVKKEKEKFNVEKKTDFSESHTEQKTTEETKVVAGEQYEALDETSILDDEKPGQIIETNGEVEAINSDERAIARSQEEPANENIQPETYTQNKVIPSKSNKNKKKKKNKN